MNIKNVKALAEMMNGFGLTSIELSEGETTIKLEKKVDVVAFPVDDIKMNSENNEVIEKTIINSETITLNNHTEIKSPLVGIFYSAPSPDSAPFVTIGSKVKTGDVLCVVEAMKLMNEIISEKDGEIVDICVKNGDIAEFGQVLFKII